MRYLVFGLLSLVCYFFVEFVHSWVLSWLFYMAFVISLLALRVTARPAKLLETTRRLSETHVPVGQPVTIQVTVDWQRAAGPGWVQVQDQLPESLRPLSPSGTLMTLGAESTSRFTYTVTGQRRGYLPIGPLEITIGDFFGIMRTSATSANVDYLTVYPHVVPIPPLRLPSNRPIGDAASTKRIYEDATRVVGVRDYAPGDTLTKIHWKTTARTGSLVSKLSEPSTSVEVNLLLNLHAGDYPDIGETVDLACSTAASVAASLLAEKHLVGLQSNGEDPLRAVQESTFHQGITIRPDKGAFQNMAILSALGRLQCTEASTLAAYLTDVYSTLPWTASTLLITHRLADDSLVVLDGLKRHGFELAVIIIGTGEQAETARRSAASLHIPLAAVEMEKHLGQLEFWQPGRD